jgi:hypothetical protein
MLASQRLEILIWTSFLKRLKLKRMRLPRSRLLSEVQRLEKSLNSRKRNRLQAGITQGQVLEDLTEITIGVVTQITGQL